MTVGEMFILLVAGLTSVGTCILGGTVLRLPWRGLWVALSKVCECVGLTVVFFLLNLILAIMAVFAARLLMGRFFSLYDASDVTLLVLSLLQALAFREWRASSRRNCISAARDGRLRYKR